MKYRKTEIGLCVLALCACLLGGCGGSGGDTAGGETPAFSLAWSEYPSWSVFGVADAKGLIDSDEGKLGPVEEKWGVDIVLKEADYDTCLTLYGSGTVDAVCMTNMDSLAPSLGRDSVAVLPTSTSVGADACIVVGVDSVEGLKEKDTYGLEKSVSQYAFERCLTERGFDPSEFPFKNMDPAAAATAVQTGQENIDSIMVWNPFVLQTLRTKDGSTVMFDSSEIPEEIIDMVVVGKDSLAKPKGEEFACAVIDTFYQVNQLMADPKEGDDTLVALGAKFSSLPLEDMKIVVQQTQFYKTPEEGLGLFEREKFRGETMPMVVDFCVSHDIVEKKPTVGFDAADSQLNFDGSFMKKLAEKE